MSDEHDEVIDGEVLDDAPPSTELTASAAAPPANQGAGPLVNLWNTRTPSEVVTQISAVATALADVIKQQGLSKNLGGDKDHVEIEGWQTAATFLGLQAMTVGTARVHPKTRFPVKTTRKVWEGPKGQRVVKEEKTHEWTCEGWSFDAVHEVRTMDGRVVGRGEGTCSREEKNWMTAEDSAVKGMAQTRAQSRALKQALGFIVGMAGYNTTPKEEMDAAGVKAPDAGPALPVANAAQKKSLNAALMWLLPEAEAKAVWGAIKTAFGGELYGPAADAIVAAIGARKVLDEPPETPAAEAEPGE